MKPLIAITFILFLTGCDFGGTSKKNKIDVKKAASVGGSSVTGTVDGGYGPYCMGSSDDGYADQSYPQSPLFIYPFSLANGATWTPGAYPIATDTVSGVELKNLPLGEAFSFFKNDGSIFIRIKLNPMPNLANNNSKTCWNRQVPGAAPLVGYSKAKFRVNAFTVVTNGSGSYTKTGVNLFVGDFEADISGCSPIIKIPNLSGNSPTTATVFEVTQILTDTNCLLLDHYNYSDTYKEQQKKIYCPVSASPKTMCVDGIIEVSTNSTHFFKGHNRSDF